MQKTLLKYLSIILGLLFCVFIIWNRLLRTRKPIDLFTEYSIIRICIYFSLFMLSLILIIYYLRQILEISSKGLFLKSLLTKPLVVSIIIFIQEYILNSPKNLYEWLYQRIKIKPFIDRCCKFIQKYNIGENDPLLKGIIIIIASIRIIVLIFFIHGIFFMHNFAYFFKCLPLLLIPVLFSIMLYSINHLATRNKEIIETFINIEQNPENEDDWQLSRNEEYADLTDNQVIANGKLWEVYCYAISTIEWYYCLEKKIKPHINIFYYSLYAIGWGYILYRIYLNEYS